MGFSGFQILNTLGSYINPEKIGGFANVADVSSFGSVVADQFLSQNFVNSAIGKVLRRTNFFGCGFIVDTVTKQRLVFQYTVNGKEQGGAEYTLQQTLARSVPQYQYKGGKERLLTMPIIFSMQENNREDVQRSVRWLRSLAYPSYLGGSEVSISPHPVVVVQGKLYWKDLWIVKDFNVEWGEARDPVTQLPNEATVNLTLAEISSKGKSHEEVLFI